MGNQATRQISVLFGSNLRAARLAKGLTQHQLALLVDSMGNNVSRWERGEHEPMNYMVARLADALDLTIADLYRDEDSEPIAA